MFPETSGLNFHQAHAVSWNMAFLVSTLESVVCLFVICHGYRFTCSTGKGRRTDKDRASLLFINFSLAQPFRLQVSDSNHFIGNCSRIPVPKFACLMKYFLLSFKSQDSEVARTMGNRMMGGEDQWAKKKYSLNSGYSVNSDNIA